MFGGYDATGGRKELDEILARRAAALRAKDEAGWLAALDPGDQKLIDREKALFANLSQFTWDDFHYITEKSVTMPVVDGKPLVFSPVIAVMRLAADGGVGGISPAEAYRYTASRKDGKLVITGITGSRNAEDDIYGGRSLLTNAPWHDEKLTVLQAGDIWLVADSTVRDLKAYQDAASSESAKVTALWGDRIRFPGSVLFFTNNAANLNKWYGLKNMDRFEGVQIPQFGVRKNGEIYDQQFAGGRIVINLPRIASDGANPRLVIRHELAHAVAARAVDAGSPFGGLGPPRWAVEGFARWVENLEEPGLMAAQHAYARSGFDGKFPGSKSFYGKGISRNYAVGSTVFTFVEKIKGRDAAVEFYANVIKYDDTLDNALVDLPSFDGICKNVTGLSAGAFRSQWVSHVRGRS
ncbi:hypothetical protein GCM10027589_00980 [Actinocorallia lasiicapitis]